MEERDMERPRQSFWGLWNISFGFLGIQVAFALQNADMARIFQTLGAKLDELPILLIAGAVTGLVVQPLVGHFSDRTWGRLGRRRPYFLGGAVLTALALVILPNAPNVLVAAVALWLLNSALNVSMEPFRAFVGDMVPTDQRARGYAIQTMFIGVGAVIGSIAPWVLAHAGIANTAPANIVPPSVRYGFYIGAAAILAAVSWTVFSVQEYTPEQLATFESPGAQADTDTLIRSGQGPVLLIVGLLLTALIWVTHQDYQLYIIGVGLALFGGLQMFNKMHTHTGVVAHILSDLAKMPPMMRKLGVVQFFTWFALPIMWAYLTPIVTQYFFYTTDTTSAQYNEGGNFVGLLYVVFNGVAALAALLLLPTLAKRIGEARTHAACLALGALSYASILIVHDKYALVASFTGLGITWASILSMPYVLLTAALPSRKFGIYMGIFNFFIVLPQLLMATVMGSILKAFFPSAPIWTMAFAAAAMLMAAIAMLRVDQRGQASAL
jgi:maltose/moltooligosaccharide transporter